MDRFSDIPFNQRQIRLMEHEVKNYVEGGVSLGFLLQKLKGLFWSLEAPDEGWSEDFLSEWGGLETVNAINLFNGERETANGERETANGERETANGLSRLQADQASISEYIKNIHQLILGEVNADSDDG